MGERKNKGDTWHTRPLYYVFPLWRKGETEKGVADLLSPSTFRLSVHDRDDIAHKSFRAMHTNARPFLDRTVHESVETNRAGGSSTKPNRTGSWIRRKKSSFLSLSLSPPSFAISSLFLLSPSGCGIPSLCEQLVRHGQPSSKTM